jgi:outer membrane lipoprotein
MRCRRFLATISIAVVSWLGGGCMPRYVVPEQLDRQVDRTVSFSQLKQDVERHKGASLVLGGVVLNARLLREGTQIEVLQLPLDAADRPAGPLEYSEGRFLLTDPARRDPAVLLNRRVTVVGEVIGTKVQTVDESEYAFPYLSARFIHVWARASGYPYDMQYPYYYPDYYPYSYPSLSLELYPFWYGPLWYDAPHAVPPPHRFEPPPASRPPPSPPRPPSPSPGGGPRGRF